MKRLVLALAVAACVVLGLGACSGGASDKSGAGAGGAGGDLALQMHDTDVAVFVGPDGNALVEVMGIVTNNSASATATTEQLPKLTMGGQTLEPGKYKGIDGAKDDQIGPGESIAYVLLMNGLDPKGQYAWQFAPAPGTTVEGLTESSLVDEAIAKAADAKPVSAEEIEQVKADRDKKLDEFAQAGVADAEAAKVQADEAASK